MRYFIIDSEIYEGHRYRIIYDTKYAHFHTVQRQDPDGKKWRNQSFVDENFYQYYPGQAKNIRSTDKLPNWK